MRKLLVVTALSVMVAFSAMAVPISAAGAVRPAPSRQLIVPFSGSSTFDVSTPTCSFLHQSFDATLGTRRSFANLHLDGCVAFATQSDFSGSFTIVVHDRGQLTGAAAGSIVEGASASCTTGQIGASLDFVLTPTSGTRRFRHAAVTVHLVGTWCSPAAPNVPGPISGTLTIKHTGR